MKIFDISRTLSNDSPPWPGDTAFQFELTWKMAAGATVNVGAITMSVHNGTHTDAPFHFDPSGRSIEKMPLETYIGPAVVVDLTPRYVARAKTSEAPIEVTDLESCAELLAKAPRLLFKTGVWTDSKTFPERIPVITPKVVDWLQSREVQLLGVDLPSVDPIDAKQLTNHHALTSAGIAILESLDLSMIAAGLYHLAALPLKIAESDAGPVRAVLWREQ
jgi:arylformamidase